MLNSSQDWLLFLPQLPSTPSSLRVTVWRRVRSLGAVGLQNGVWILPRSAALEQALRELLTEVEKQGGKGLLLVTVSLDEAHQSAIIERFRAERDLEYVEFAEHCQNLLTEIEKESQQQNFSFAELEENEHELHKLTSWLRKIQKRDVFEGNQAARANTSLTECQRELNDFARRVYEREGISTSEQQT